MQHKHIKSVAIFDKVCSTEKKEKKSIIYVQKCQSFFFYFPQDTIYFGVMTKVCRYVFKVVVLLFSLVYKFIFLLFVFLLVDELISPKDIDPIHRYVPRQEQRNVSMRYSNQVECNVTVDCNSLCNVTSAWSRLQCAVSAGLPAADVCWVFFLLP